MTQPCIRPASTRDVQSLVNVYRSAYRENRQLGFPAKAEAVTPIDIRDWLENSRVYVAEIDEQVIGSVRAEETGPDRLKISRLGVHESWKRHGVGTQLLNDIEAIAREEGFETIWLTTPANHPYLPELYRDRGYERVGLYPLPYREYDEIRMEKPIGRS